MTLPVEALKRRSAAPRYDVAVVGAGMAGLICAAVLSRAGRRVVVIDRAKRPGGRLQSVQHQGFAVDLGPAVWEAPGLLEVLGAAGVEEPGLACLAVRDAIRLAVLDGDGNVGPALPLPIPGAVPSPSTLDAVRALYEVPPRVFAALGELYGELASAEEDQLERWRDTTVLAWAKEREIEKPLVAALVRSAVLLGAGDGSDASLACLASVARALSEGRSTLAVCGDTPIAGARGVVQALVDGIVASGGDLRLATHVTGVALESGEFRGLAVQRDEVPFRDEILAERCVLALPPAEVARLLPAGTPSGREQLDGEAPHRQLGVAWAIHLADATDEPETRIVVRLVPPARAHDAIPGASLVWQSATAPRIAPPGYALIRGSAPLSSSNVSDATLVAREVDRLRAALIALHPRIAERIEWECSWIADHALGTPMQRATLPFLAPGCGGIYLANEHVSLAGVTSRGVTGAALVGHAVAERILA